MKSRLGLQLHHMTSYHPIRVRGQAADPLPMLRPGAALKREVKGQQL